MVQIRGWDQEVNISSIYYNVGNCLETWKTKLSYSNGKELTESNNQGFSLHLFLTP